MAELHGVPLRNPGIARDSVFRETVVPSTSSGRRETSSLSSLLRSRSASCLGDLPRISFMTRYIAYCMVEYVMLLKFQSRRASRMSTKRPTSRALRSTTSSLSEGLSGARYSMYCRLNPNESVW